MIRFLKLMLLVPLLAACVPGQAAATDTNTNWLGRCERDAECMEGLQCVCGVCSIECEDSERCAELDESAACLVSDTCSEVQAACGRPELNHVGNNRTLIERGLCTRPIEAYSLLGECNVALDCAGEPPIEVFQDPCGCGCESVATMGADAGVECAEAAETANEELQQVLSGYAGACSQDVDCTTEWIPRAYCGMGCDMEVAIEAARAARFVSDWAAAEEAACPSASDCPRVDISCEPPTPSEPRCVFEGDSSPDAGVRPGSCALVPLDLSCEGRVRRADRLLMNAIDTASRGCHEDRDCVEVPMPALSCTPAYDSCNTLVPLYSPNADALQTAISELDAELCIQFSPDCSRPEVECTAPLGQQVRCVLSSLASEEDTIGTCRYAQAEPSATAGPPSAP